MTSRFRNWKNIATLAIILGFAPNIPYGLYEQYEIQNKKNDLLKRIETEEDDKERILLGFREVSLRMEGAVKRYCVGIPFYYVYGIYNRFK